MKMYRLYCPIRRICKEKKKRFCIWLFLRGFNENATFLGTKIMPIHASVTVCGWSIQASNCRRGVCHLR